MLMVVLFLQFKRGRQDPSWFRLILLQVFHVIDNNQLLLLRIGTDGRILERYIEVLNCPMTEHFPRLFGSKAREAQS